MALLYPSPNDSSSPCISVGADLLVPILFSEQALGVASTVSGLRRINIIEAQHLLSSRCSQSHAWFGRNAVLNHV
jgi:hypothetical protein